MAATMSWHKITELLKMTQDELYDYVFEMAQSVKMKGYHIHYDRSKLGLMLFPEKPGLYPVLASHLDTVGIYPPDEVLVEKRTLNDGTEVDAWVGFHRCLPCVLGGDDRCGVWAMLELMQAEKPEFGFIFSKDEEIGHEGAQSLVRNGLLNTYKDQIAYFIELDRLHNNQLSSYPCRIAPYFLREKFYTNQNEEFDQLLNSFFFEGRPYIQTRGAGTDIQEYCGATHLCGINLSVGYYNPHSESEFIDIEYLKKVPAITLSLIQHLGIRKYAIEV